MQEKIMQEIFEMLKNKEELKDIKIYTNLEQKRVIKYFFNDEMYIIDILKIEI